MKQKLQLKTLTWEYFDKFGPCYSPQEKYGDFSGTILDILKDDRIPKADKIWAFTQEGIMDDKTLRMFAVSCAREVQHLMADQRSIDALDVAERYANGLATEEELEKAREAAGDAARETAWDAARTAAWAAAWRTAKIAAWEAARTAAGAAEWEAWAAARSAQVQIAIELINEFYQV